MIAAIYSSVLYGADYIQESIASVLPHVDAVYVVFMDAPWGNTSGVAYRGEWIPWPKHFDDARERVWEIAGWVGAANIVRGRWLGSKVRAFEAHSDTPWDRWGFAVNLLRDRFEVVLDEVVTIDPDVVFSKEEAAKAFAEWKMCGATWAQPSQVELWKTTEWEIKRPRSMVAFHRGDLDLLSTARRAGRPVPETHALSAFAYNLGFCVSESAMRWKHLTSMAFSPVVGESIPNPNWFEDKWLRWTPETRDLEPSTGCEGAIPHATRYVETVPEEIAKAVARVRAGDGRVGR